MKYRIAETGISILEWRGKPVEGWPYGSYPSSFPRRCCRLVRQADLDDDLAFDRIFWQGAPAPEHGDLVVMVPPNEGHGVSLWGDHGDAEEVHVVATIDTETWMVAIGNECT